MCKLLQLLDKSEMLKHRGARMKRVKLVKMQMANMKRKLTRQNKTLTPAGGKKYMWHSQLKGPTWAILISEIQVKM